MKKQLFFIIYNDGKSKEEKRIKSIRNLFGLKKELNDTAIKDKRNLFKLKKEIKVIKYIVLRNINNLFWVWKRKRKLL